MKKITTIFLVLLFSISTAWAGSPPEPTSVVFYNGELPDTVYTWDWGFDESPHPVMNTGYTPGTAAMKWTGYDGELGWHGMWFESDSYYDFSEVWQTESVHIKLRTPNGLGTTDTLYLLLYDGDRADWDVWDTTMYYKIANTQDLQDGEWHEFEAPLKDFLDWSDPSYFDKSKIYALSLEILDGGLDSEMYMDHIWIGSPTTRRDMTIWNGVATGNDMYTEVWGTSGDEFKTLEDAGYGEGTPAVMWENGYDQWGYIGFAVNDDQVQDMTGTWANDSLKIKIKAPAGDRDVNLVWYHHPYNANNYAWYTISETWDGGWNEFSIPLPDFTQEGSFDPASVYFFSIEMWAVVADTILFDDIWVGNPLIDYTPPPTPSNVQADGSNLEYNIVYWDDIDSEIGEKYDVYGSESPITDLNTADVFVVATGVTDFDEVHYFYSPLVYTESAFYYAVTCKDAAGNPSESFGKTETATVNSGKVRAIISMDPITFAADGNLSEWTNVMPFKLHPGDNLYTGTIDDSLDYSAKCWVAMDETNLYVAFDVYDDVFSWTAENTVDWWDDECIEFYIGLYQNDASPHSGWESGEQPDYRIEFRPDLMRFSMGEETVAEGTENYYFQPLGAADYIVEAKIPFASLRQEGDSSFVPVEGMTVPFEIFAADADVPDGYNESRLQFGDSPALNPWSDGPKSWTFAWVGTSGYYTAIEDDNNGIAATYKLGNNYPNPFNPTTTIQYSIAHPGKVELTVYNTIGQKVATLVNEVKHAGRHDVVFDAKNLASGTYFYQLRSKGFVQVKKMLILK